MAVTRHFLRDYRQKWYPPKNNFQGITGVVIVKGGGQKIGKVGLCHLWMTHNDN